VTGSPAPGSTCRGCGATALQRVLDLGSQPLPGSFPTPDDPPDPTWPLVVAVCARCMLLQLEPAGAPLESDDPAILALAAQSASLRDHAAATARTLRDELGLTAASRIVEMSSHGNRLQPAFAELGLRTMILEPDPHAATDAHGPPAGVLAGTVGRDVAAALRDELGPVDLVVDDFLLAHLPDLDGAVAGLAALIGTAGSLILTVDHALPVVMDTQFDALRHGHHVVFSLASLVPLLARHGLSVVDATLLPIYGGSLRIHARSMSSSPAVKPTVESVRRIEDDAGMNQPATYEAFGARALAAAAALREHVARANRAGRVVVGYGAPSRATTLLVTAGIDRHALPFTVDRAEAKHGRALPGSRIPIEPVERLLARRPDEVLLLAWPMADEVVAALPQVKSWGGRFIHPLPTPHEVRGSRTAAVGAGR
jgi:hypothetical protein